ncbi:hypothetical protein Tco_1500128 [Tanacetum coccineum]
MANLSEDIQCVSSDTRPPMLDRTDFASWKQRIRLYCQGKENGVNILKSIDERARVYSDLSPEDKDRYNANIRATNILLQGLPKDIYTLINHYTEAKDIWDNVKMLLEGSELTKEDKESQLYDDFEHFHQNKGETIHDYYARFAKLINDMRNIKMTMSRMQLNSKFVNNVLPEWGRFVTTVKLNRGLKDSNYDQLYAYLKQHEVQLVMGELRTELGMQIQVKQGRLSVTTATDLALNVDNVFQADNCDAFDSNVDETPTAQTMFMANLSSVYLFYDEASPSYDSEILSEVHDNDHYQVAYCEHHEVHEMHDDAQPNYGVDSHTDYTSDSNMIPYDQYVKDNAVPVVQSNVSFVPNDAYMMILNDIYESSAQCVSVTIQNHAVDNSLTAKLATYKEQVELYERRAKFELTEREQKINEQLRIVIADRNRKEENLKKELHYVKLQLTFTINHNKSMVEEVTSLKKDFKQKENKYLEEFLDMKALKEKVEDKLYKQDQSLQTVHMLCKLKPYYDEQNKVAIGYKNPLCLTRAKQVQAALYNGHEIIKINYVPAIVHNLKDTLEIVEITKKKMKDLECVKKKVKIVPHKYSKENYLATFTPHKQLTSEQIFWSKDLIKMKAEALKEQTTASRPIKALTMNNREVHLDYLKHLKKSVETLREIIEEAKVERPLDSLLTFACLYTKHSQELLEYAIGTCPKDFNPQDKKHAATSLTRKKHVTFEDQCETSNSNTHKHVEQLNIQKTNVPVPPFTGVNSCTVASGSQLRSNNKKNRILPAKSVNQKKVDEHPSTNKSSLKTTNHIDSSISSNLTIINLNSHSVCKTCNKCLIFANHDMCVVNYFHSVNASPSIKKVMRKVQQVWKPKQVKQVSKPTGKILTNVGYQRRPTGRTFTLRAQCPITRLTKSKVVPAKQTENISTSKTMITRKLSYTFQKPLTRYQRNNQQYQAIAYANQLDPNQNWGSNFPNSPSSSVFKCRFENDHFGAIMGYGDYVIGDSGISRVYYVEGLGHNLFSVGQFCDSYLEVAFRKHSCYVGCNLNHRGCDLNHRALRSQPQRLNTLPLLLLYAATMSSTPGLSTLTSDTISLESRLKRAWLNCKMVDENVPAPAPTRSNDQVLPFAAWVPIRKSNHVLDLQNRQKNPIFQIAMDILHNTNFFRAFTASASVLAIYIQQLWNTLTYVEKARTYRFQLDEDWFTLYANLLREALEITPIDQAHPFVSPPLGDAIMDFVNKLGYPECLTGKTSGHDRPKYLVLQMLWGIITNTNVEYAELIPTKKGRKDKPHVISYCRFTKLIICHLGRIHNIHQRSASPFHLAEEDLRLGNLKFVSKGKIDEVFGMPIPNELISNNIRNASYYNAYLEMVAKHDQKVATEKEGKKKSASTKQSKPKPAIEKSSKPAPAPKPKVTKEKSSKASTAKPPKPKPAKEKSTKATPLQKTGKGKVAKVHNVKSTFQLVDKPDEELAHSEPEPEPEQESADAETGVRSDKTSSGGDTEILQITEELCEDVEKQVLMDEDQARPDPGISRVAFARPDPEPTHDEFMTDLYPKDAYAIGDQFINDKSTNDEPGKLNVEAEVVSMVTVPIYQASSSVPPLSTLVIDLSPPKLASSTTQTPIFTTTTTTTTTPLPPPLQQQSITEYELVECVAALEKKLSDLEHTNKNLDNTTRNLGSRVYTLELKDLHHKINEAVRENVKEAVQIILQAPLRDRFKDLSEEDIKEMLQQRMDEFLAEKDKSRKRRCDDQVPPPPPPDSDQSKRRRHEVGASGSSQPQVPHSSAWKKSDTQDAPLSSSKQQFGPHAEQPVNDIPILDSNNISDLEDTDSADLPKTKQRPEWLKPIQDDERPVTPEPAWVIPTSQFLDVFQIEEFHKMLTDQIDWTNPEGDQGSGQALSISKLKATRYHDFGLELLVPEHMWIDDNKAYSRYGYDYLKEITLRRDDHQEYTIAEKDLKNLYPSDFEDLNLLLLQGHLNHLPGLDIRVLSTAIKLWTQNLFNEIYKFSDGTLTNIMEALYYRVKEYKVNRLNSGMNTRFWTDKDVERSKEFIHAIERRLKTRRIFQNLECFVGGRASDIDYRLLQRTE